MNKILCRFLIAALFFVTSSFFLHAEGESDVINSDADEVSAADSISSEKTPAQLYKEQHAEVVQRQYIDHGRNQAMMEAVYSDNVLFDVYRGSGEIVKLSEIADEMGNSMLAERLRLGECYYGFMGGFAACTATTGVRLVLGLAFTVFRNGFDFAKYEYGATESLNEYMTSAIVMFGVSAVTLIGSIVLGVFLYKAYRYKFSILQAQSLIQQYNKFLQKKLGVTPDVTYYDKQVGLSFRIAL
ncbi:MAG: hypothetical protein IKN25_01525 [Spirochaetales bacterium]|nr:hypothetical protein [Spirochaetales bacterium]